MYYLYYHLAGQKSSNCCLAHNTSERKTKKVRERERVKLIFFIFGIISIYILCIYIRKADISYRQGRIQDFLKSEPLAPL